MTARTGMAPLIAELRAMTQSGTADYTIAGSAYFSDDEMQKYLDRTRLLTRMLPLDPVPVRVGAFTQYLDYSIVQSLGYWFEQDTGDSTSGFFVKDGYGNVMANGTDYTINYDAMLVTFVHDTKGSAYLLDARTYDLYAAAAKVWREKAAFEGRSIDFKSDNHDIRASQRRDYCLKMAEEYESKTGVSGEGGIQAATFMRTDENLAEPDYGHSTAPSAAPYPRTPEQAPQEYKF